MASIYIHIPFCKQACNYCNFHFSTSLKHKAPLLAALKREIALRGDFFAEGTAIESLYFGGGTPSLLSFEELLAIFRELEKHFNLAELSEITLEANPDDMRPEYLRALARESPINRLSIGIQSFYEEDLLFMRRAHNAREALAAIDLARHAGFESMSIDLIYGSPELSMARWEESLRRVEQWGIPHLSCYALTVEENTLLAHEIAKGKRAALDEDKAAEQFQYLSNWAEAGNYSHYEISNLCLPGKEAIHNSAYWQGKSYLGLGPSAHSFDGKKRSWNIANNAEYIRSLQQSELPLEYEDLEDYQRYNERLMSMLRLRSGLSLASLEADFGAAYRAHFEQALRSEELAAYMHSPQAGFYTFSKEGRLLSDGLLVDLFLDKNI